MANSLMFFFLFLASRLFQFNVLAAFELAIIGFVLVMLKRLGTNYTDLGIKVQKPFLLVLLNIELATLLYELTAYSYCFVK